MFNSYKILLPTLLAIATSAIAQPSFRITSFISHRDITDSQKGDIRQYASGWADAMLTDDAATLSEARRALAEPLDKRWSMSNTARMHYGEALLDAFEPFLSKENKNQMAAVNALQVLSLLGTERSVITIMRHASSASESRVAVRHWAAASLEDSFQTGRLPLSRLTTVATLLTDAASREPVWHVASRQLQALSSLSNTPGLRRSELLELQKLSFQLQVLAISNILEDIATQDDATLRMRSVRYGLASLRFQLIEPGFDAEIKSNTINDIKPVLLRILQVVSDQAQSARKNEDLATVYAGTIETADAMLRRHAGGRDKGDVSLRDTWMGGNDLTLSDVIKHWQKQLSSK